MWQAEVASESTTGGYYNNTSGMQQYFIPRFDGLTPHDRLYHYTADRSANENAMQKGILNKITYPTKGYSEFVYEAHRSEKYGISGGVRIKEIRNYQPDGTLAERKWYKYGEDESGRGVSNTDLNIADFITETATVVFKQGGDMQYSHKGTYRGTHYQSFPKLSYFASGSSVVYPQVTEYVGDATQDYGKTVYLYWPNLDQYMPSQGYTYRPGSAEGYLRTYPWRTGILRSKTVYRKDASGYTPIYDLYNTYTETNKAEFRNLRVLPYLSQRNEPEGNGSSAPNVLREFCRYHSLYGSDYKSPYNYYNYYTTTGLQLISSTMERKDGVTKKTSFEYNKYGKPTLITEQSSNGEDDRVTIKKYPADVPSSSVYVNMIDRNIVTPEIEQIVQRGNNFLSATKTEYTSSRSSNPDLFVPAWIKLSNGPDTLDPFPRVMQYHRYDTYGNPVYVTAADRTNIVYLWSYEAVYPVIQVRNATYDQVAAILTPVRITSLSANKNPTEQTIKDCVATLNAQLPDALVTSYTYVPMVGVRSITEPSGRTTLYDHDSFGRLAKIADEEGNALQSYEYNYRKSSAQATR